MGAEDRELSWRERARRVREGEPELADRPVDEPYEALQDLVATILRRSFDAVVLCTREGEYLEVSDSFCEITGYTRAELLGQTSATLALVDPEGIRRRMLEEVKKSIRGRYDNVIVRKDGTPRVLEFSHQYLENGLTLVIIRDVTERRLREQELDRLAREDMLTGALNRRGFTARVDVVLDQAQIDGSDVHLVVADVDGLKAINDAWGHEYGDKALVTAAAALRHVYGPDASVGRLGGDEFAVVVIGGVPDLEANAAELRAFLATNGIGPDGDERPVSLSLGFATAAGGAGSVDRLLALADETQYVAKREHRATRPTDD